MSDASVRRTNKRKRDPVEEKKKKSASDRPTPLSRHHIQPDTSLRADKSCSKPLKKMYFHISEQMACSRPADRTGSECMATTSIRLQSHHCNQIIGGRGCRCTDGVNEEGGEKKSIKWEGEITRWVRKCDYTTYNTVGEKE